MDSNNVAYEKAGASQVMIGINGSIVCQENLPHTFTLPLPAWAIDTRKVGSWIHVTGCLSSLYAFSQQLRECKYCVENFNSFYRINVMLRTLKVAKLAAESAMYWKQTVASGKQEKFICENLQKHAKLEILFLVYFVQCTLYKCKKSTA